MLLLKLRKLGLAERQDISTAIRLLLCTEKTIYANIQYVNNETSHQIDRETGNQLNAKPDLARVI